MNTDTETDDSAMPLETETSKSRDEIIRSRRSPLAVDYPRLSELKLKFYREPLSGGDEVKMEKTVKEWDELFYQETIQYPDKNTSNFDVSNARFSTNEAAYTLALGGSSTAKSFLIATLSLKQPATRLTWFYIDSAFSIHPGSDVMHFFVASGTQIMDPCVRIFRDMGDPPITDYFRPRVMEEQLWSDERADIAAFTAYMYDKYFRETELGGIQKFKENGCASISPTTVVSEQLDKIYFMLNGIRSRLTVILILLGFLLIKIFSQRSFH